MKPPSREQCLEWAKEENFCANDSGAQPIWGWEQFVQQDFIEALINRAYKEGAEAMREEAARVVAESSLPDMYSEPCLQEIANEIRNLKVEK